MVRDEEGFEGMERGRGYSKRWETVWRYSETAIEGVEKCRSGFEGVVNGRCGFEGVERGRREFEALGVSRKGFWTVSYPLIEGVREGLRL